MSESKEQLPLKRQIVDKYLKAKILQTIPDNDLQCKIATNNYERCGLTRSFRNKNREMLACGRFCMKNCDKWELAHIFNHPRKVTLYFNNGEKATRKISKIEFKLWVNNSSDIFDWKVTIDPERPYNELNRIVISTAKNETINLIRTENDKLLAAENLCKFIKRYIDRNLLLSVIVKIGDNYDYNIEDGDLIAGFRFDKPFIKPEFNWRIQSSEYISLDFSPSNPTDIRQDE